MPWKGRRYLGWVLLAGALCVLSPPVASGAAPPAIESTYADHTRAVELGRSGDYDAALQILQPLLLRFPDDYPLNRDYILIAAWKGDCRTALARFGYVLRAPKFEPYFVGPVADCAVRRARAGDYDTGLSVLKALRSSAPDPYPLQRDIVLITIWKGDCSGALREYDRIRGRETYEPYFAAPMSDCLLAQHRPREALTLLRAAQRSNADDASLRYAVTKAEVALRLDKGVDEVTPYAAFDAYTNSSDQGLREWIGDIESGAGVAKGTQLYARYHLTRSMDTQYANGNLDRAGVGVRYRFNEQWRIEQEFSADLHHAGLGAGSTRLDYYPRDTWQVRAGYTTYAEDIPLRARAAGIKAHRADGSAEYNSTDYIWYWGLSAGYYDFTDSNIRRSLYTTAGYAYQMLPEREQRVFVEWYQSSNSFGDAVYFNPKQDRYLGVLQRTDFVYDSRFKRHVDHVYLSIGQYLQEGFDAHTRWGVKYAQDYDFDDDNALLVAAGYYRNVYDGASEYDTSLELHYRRRF